MNNLDSYAFKSPATTYRGRFAPSPTGFLHLGSASTALCAWLAARSQGGAFVIRNEDLDQPRVVPGALDAILDDLHWLGLDWDEGPGDERPAAPYDQSSRRDLYEGALKLLSRAELTYPCDCSRAEIASVASAPHGDSGGVVYPGFCRNKPHDRQLKKRPATRLAVPQGQQSDVSFVDEVFGLTRSRVADDAGDFVLRRADGVYAYQLAVVVDDITQRITEVVRGADLLDSTPRQILLARMLGAQAPSYAHVPLVVGEDGSRLSKRDSARSLRGYKNSGGDPLALVARLAAALQLVPPDCHRIHPRELVSRFAWDRLPKGPIRVNVKWR